MFKNLSREKKRKFKKAPLTVIDDSKRLEEFHSELKELTTLKRISKMPLNIEYFKKEDEDAMGFFFVSKGKYTYKICDYIKLYYEDWYKVFITPCKNGVEIESLETYQTGKGIGS